MELIQVRFPLRFLISLCILHSFPKAVSMGEADIQGSDQLPSKDGDRNGGGVCMQVELNSCGRKKKETCLPGSFAWLWSTAV